DGAQTNSGAAPPLAMKASCRPCTSPATSAAAQVPTRARSRPGISAGASSAFECAILIIEAVSSMRLLGGAFCRAGHQRDARMPDALYAFMICESSAASHTVKKLPMPCRCVRACSAGEIAQQSTRQRRAAHGAARVGDGDAIDPHAVHAPRRCGEARGAAGQVEYPLARAAANAGGIEEQEIGGEARREPAAIPEAEDLRRAARELPHRLGHAERAALAHPVAEQVQAEAGIAEECQMRAG